MPRLAHTNWGNHMPRLRWEPKPLCLAGPSINLLLVYPPLSSMSKNCRLKEQSRSPRIPIQEGGEGCPTKRRRVAVGPSVLPEHEGISRVPGSCIKVGTWARERTAPRCTREVPVDQRGAEPVNARAEAAAASGAASPAAWRAELSSPMPSVSAGSTVACAGTASTGADAIVWRR